MTRADLAHQKLAKLDQVCTVALAGVIAEMFLELEVVEKLFYQWAEILLAPIARITSQRITAGSNVHCDGTRSNK